MEEFKSGDVVQLKSGGPKMTVGESGIYNQILKYKCVWFDDKGKKETGVFAPDNLKKLESE